MRRPPSPAACAVAIAIVFAGAACASGGAERSAAGQAAAGQAATARAIADPSPAIQRVLDDQVMAWNRGDLEAFMDGYWRSEDLVFTSGGNVQRGWQTTLDRYVASYGNSPETMGRLAFSDLEVHPLGVGAAWALGRWSLDRDGETMGGVFSLIFREIDGRWVIIHDHTSLSP